MPRIHIFLMFLCLAAGFPAQAKDFSIGLTAGSQIAAGGQEAELLEKPYVASWSGGLMFDLNFGVFGIRPELLYGQKKYSFDDYAYDYNSYYYNSNRTAIHRSFIYEYAEVAVLFKINFARKSPRLFLALGPAIHLPLNYNTYASTYVYSSNTYIEESPLSLAACVGGDYPVGNNLFTLDLTGEMDEAYIGEPNTRLKLSLGWAYTLWSRAPEPRVKRRRWKPEPPVTDAATGMDATYEELSNLKKLKDQGFIGDKEYEKAQKKIMEKALAPAK